MLQTPDGNGRVELFEYDVIGTHPMAADLTDTPVTANVLLPGGATDTGMVPDEIRAELRPNLLDPAIMGPPIVWLACPDAAGVHDERIVARDFDDWLATRLEAPQL